MVQFWLTDAERNSSEQFKQLFQKICDILEKGGAPPGDLTRKAAKIIESRRVELAQKMHVSINMKLERLLGFITSGRLQPSAPDNQYDRLFRDNTEKCLNGGTHHVPIYGGLNIDSPEGAAPSFGRHVWVRLKNDSIRHCVTFTARDSYAIVLPFLSRYDPTERRKSVRREVYTWTTVLNFALNNFWGTKDAGVQNYVEAQVWDNVELQHIESIHLHRRIELEAGSRMASLPASPNIAYARSKIVVFD